MILHVENLSILVQFVGLCDRCGVQPMLSCFWGGWLWARHVSIKVLWWLALAMMIRENLSLELYFSSGGRS